MSTIWRFVAPYDKTLMIWRSHSCRHMGDIANWSFIYVFPATSFLHFYTPRLASALYHQSSKNIVILNVLERKWRLGLWFLAGWRYKRPTSFFVINAGPENPTVLVYLCNGRFSPTVRKSTRKSTLSNNSNASNGRWEACRKLLTFVGLWQKDKKPKQLNPNTRKNSTFYSFLLLHLVHLFSR